jgi:hypothetical protein
MWNTTVIHHGRVEAEGSGEEETEDVEFAQRIH